MGVNVEESCMSNPHVVYLLMCLQQDGKTQAQRGDVSMCVYFEALILDIRPYC